MAPILRLNEAELQTHTSTVNSPYSEHHLQNAHYYMEMFTIYLEYTLYGEFTVLLRYEVDSSRGCRLN